MFFFIFCYNFAKNEEKPGEFGLRLFSFALSLLSIMLSFPFFGNDNFLLLSFAWVIALEQLLGLCLAIALVPFKLSFTIC